MTEKPTPTDPATTRARGRILDAAEKLFASKGFAGTPTAQIARDADVPKGLLFYYFPTKLALLEALLAERAHISVVDAAAVTVPGDPVRTLLNIAAGVHLARSKSEVLRVVLWHEQHTNDVARAALDKHRHAVRTAIGNALAASVPASVKTAALHVAAAAWEAIISSHPLEEAGDSLASLARLIVAGLTPQRAG